MNERTFAPSLFFCYSLFHIHVQVLKPWVSLPIRFSCDESYPFPSYSQHSGPRTLSKTPFSPFRYIPTSSKTIQPFRVGLHPSFSASSSLRNSIFFLRDSLSMLSGPPASGLPRDLLEMQILRSIQWGRGGFRSIQWRRGGRVWNPATCVLTSPAGDSEYEIHCCGHVTCNSLPKHATHESVFTLSHPAQIILSFCPFKSCVASKPWVIGPSSLSLHWIPGSALIWTLFWEPLAVHPVLVCFLCDLPVTCNTAFLDSSRFSLPLQD